MRNFVSLAVRGDKKLAQQVRQAARSRGLKVGDYLRSLIDADNTHISFFADNARQNTQLSKSINSNRQEK